jgi:hypothetical protein
MCSVCTVPPELAFGGDDHRRGGSDDQRRVCSLDFTSADVYSD